MNFFKTEAKQELVQWRPYKFTEGFNRRFLGNAVLFINTGTAMIRINDMHELQPGQSVGLECDPNEIDTTSYKVDFPTVGGVCNVWIKENRNADKSLYEKAYTKDRSKIPNKRDWDKKVMEKRMEARNKGVKRNWSDFWNKIWKRSSPRGDF